MSKVSVIVPVYNAQKYLEDCLDSVLNQTFCDWELILIDDGSSDDSNSICEEYAQKDSRIHLYTQKNSGPAAAVYNGISKAESEYVMFLDADDWYDKDMIDVLYHAVSAQCADGAMSGYKKVDSQGRFIGKPLEARERSFTKSEIHDQILIPFYERKADIYECWSAPRWDKIYRKSILIKTYNDISRSTPVGQDLEMNLGFLHYADKVITLRDSYPYNYRVLETSRVHGYNTRLEQRNQALADSIELLANKQGYSFSAKRVMEDNNTLGLMHELLHTADMPGKEKLKYFIHLLKKLHKKEKALKLIVYEDFPGKNTLIRMKNAVLK